MAPGGVGLSSKPAPVLYWFLPEPHDDGVSLSVTKVVTGDVLLEVAIPHVFEAGAQAFDLAERGVTLEPDVDYRWSVSLHHAAAGAVEADAYIRYHPPAEGSSNPVDLARAGYWYDACEALADNPATQAALLDKAGQSGLADRLRSMAGA